MKFLIAAIVIPIVLYLANKQNEKLLASLEGLDDNQLLEAKKKWAYEFWKVRLKHFMITLVLLISGIITFLIATKFHAYFDTLAVLALALIIGSFVYFFSAIGLKNARYNLLMKEFDYEGISKNEIINQFKEWKAKNF